MKVIKVGDSLPLPYSYFPCISMDDWLIKVEERKRKSVQETDRVEKANYQRDDKRRCLLFRLRFFT